MNDIKELEQRIVALELHREYDVKLNEEQTAKLNDAVAKINEIYLGLQWIVRIGKWLSAATAFVLALVGIKNGITPNG